MSFPKIIGSQIIRLTSVDSTNKFVIGSIPHESYEEGTVILASEQYAGRGLENNHWESQKGKNLTFSVVLYPSFINPSEQFMLTKVISLGILDLIRKLLPAEPVRVKWPNDVYIRDGKAAGILVNNTMRGNHFDHSIVGIGLNVNQKKFYSEAPNPVSLIHFLQNDTDLEECLEKLTDSLNSRYLQLKMRQNSIIDRDYHESLYRLEKRSAFLIGKEKFYAKIQGVSEYGQLILKKENGETAKFEFKEIEFEI